MNLSVSQVQNVLRTYQKQVRDERVKAILGIREEPSLQQDRVDISHEGRSRLEGNASPEREPDIPPRRR